MKTSVGVESYISRDTILKRNQHILRAFIIFKLLSDDASDEDINNLYFGRNSLVSLTKGEGFGRPLLEFSLTGKPVIATNFSGHVDFLHKIDRIDRSTT